MSIVLLPPATGRHARIAPIIATCLVIAVALSAARGSFGWVAAMLVLWSIVVVSAALIDFQVGRLPDAIVLPGLVAVIAGAWLSSSFTGVLAGAALFGVPVLVVHLLRPDGMGFGDVKFSVLLGAGIGLVAVPLVVPAYVLAAISHSVACVALRAGGRLVPFGPSLAVGSILIVVGGLIGRS